jgi:ligand-binding sensor protein
MDTNIDPVMRRFIADEPRASAGSNSSGLVQTRLDRHLKSYNDDTRFAKLWSKRLSSAVVNLTGNTKITADRSATPSTQKLRSNPRGAKRKKGGDDSQV